jgi:hypothetical protein
MRSCVLVFALALAWACGPVDQSGGTASGGATDAGTTAADGGTGTGSGPADAGGGNGGGGGSGGGTGGGGGGTANLDCTGVTPNDLGGSATVTVAHGGGEVCWNATADLSGNVAGEAHASSMGDNWTGNWQIWSASGALRGGFSGVGGDVFGQQDGFQSTQGKDHVVWSSSGQANRRTGLDDRCAHEAFNSSTGGSLVLERCGTNLSGHRFDAAGNKVASAELGNAAQAAGVVDAQGRVLVAVANGGGYAARWYDGNLAPVSDFFQLAGNGASKPIVRPLVVGGAAIQIDGNWVATSRSGVGAADAVPDWLSSHKSFDLQTIRQGRAYALIPRSGAPARDTLDLYSGAGERCGQLKFPVDGLSMGPDGTVIGSSGDAGCTHQFWSGLLR